jgi:hypothetical protein
LPVIADRQSTANRYPAGLARPRRPKLFNGLEHTCLSPASRPRLQANATAKTMAGLDCESGR